MISVITVATPQLGDRSYLVHDGEVGVVIDPQRDIERVVAAAADAGVRIVSVAETHVHNDYVSGGPPLARMLDVPYLVAADEAVAFDRQGVCDGDVVDVGESFSLRVMATPGHTPHHLSYVALESGRPSVVCTGGSLLFGSVGRTDLLGSDNAEPLAHLQYRSAKKLCELPGWVGILPTHGFGSFCSPGASADVDASTVEEQRVANLACRAENEGDFVRMLLGSATAYPTYYRHMGALNREGRASPDLLFPNVLDGVQVTEMAMTTAWVVDLRKRRPFADAHIRGSLNFEQERPFTSYIGWLLPDGVPLVLAAESGDAISTAQVDLSRIGIDEVAGCYVGAIPPLSDPSASASYLVRGFADLEVAREDPATVALDVRRDDEWESGHLADAIHVPLHELAENLAALPPGTLWVHCAAGYRAAIAASMLQRHGRQVVLIDGAFGG